MSAAVTDPWARTDSGSVRTLEGINPLAKLAAPLPAMILLVFVRDLATPLAFIAVAYVVVLLGARLTARVALLLFVALPAAALVIGASMSLWTDPARVGGAVLAYVG